MAVRSALLLLLAVASASVAVTRATHEDATWAPLSDEHVAQFFQRPRFSLVPHLKTLHARRLTEQPPPHRRLGAGECLKALDEMKTKFQVFPSALEDIKNKIGKLGKFDVREVVSKVQDMGGKIRDFDFAKMGRATVEGAFNSLVVVDAITTWTDIGDMKKQAREVIDKIKQVEGVVRSIGNDILEVLERSDFDHFINQVLESSNHVFDPQIDKLEELTLECSRFDYAQGNLLVAFESNFQLCTHASDEDHRKACRAGVGVAAIGAMIQFISAASFCDASAMISQSQSAHSIASLKVDAERLVHSVMASIPPPPTSSGDGSSSNADEYKDIRETIATYEKNITDFSNEAVPLDNPDSPDSTFMKDVMADINTRWMGSTAAVENYTASDLYKNMTALHPEAGLAGEVVGMALGKSQSLVMDKLGGLQEKVIDQHNERMGLYDKINNTLWTNHAEFMGQVTHMSTVFTEQHTERMGRLQGVQNSLGNIQSKTANGFSQLRGRIQDMGRKFVAQVQGIEQNVVSTGAETTSYLSNAVMDANREIENRINGVGDTVIRNHEKIMSALGDAQETAANEFGATQNLLYSASDSFRQTIDNGLGMVADTMSNAFNQVSDVVYKKMEEGHTIMSQVMAGMASDFSIVDDKLVILENRAANMSKQLDIAKEFLLDIHAQFAQIEQMLDDLPTVVQQEMFQSDVDGLHRKYQNMRKVYRDYLESDLPVKTIIESCVQFQIYDLFLRFLRLVDVSDEELPRQLENFDFDRASYEQFGVMVISVVNDLSFFDGVCAKAQFSATLKDLEVKAKGQADLILAATSKLAHQVEDVIPALMLTNRVQRKIEAASQVALGSNGAQTVENLRAEIQRGLSDFAYVTVIHAGNDGELLVDHLDRGAGTSDGKPRHSGAIISQNQKLAVVWSQTPRIPIANMATANQTELLRRGVYRGNITSTSKTCFVASSSDQYYPKCDQCSCLHYEDFASTTDPMAGRAVTYLADKSYDAAFAVETVFSADTDYVLNALQLSVGSLTPGATATAQFTAPVISPSSQRSTVLTLWEGTSGIGRFDVVPSDIKGTLLSENELTLTITHGAKLFRYTFSLFCDGYVKNTVLPDSELQLRYACAQVPRAKAPSELEAQGYPFVASGLPTKRLDRAVCVASGSRKTCKVSGAVNATEPNSQFSFGADVDGVTLLTPQTFNGLFAVCRDCTPETLASLVQKNGFSQVVIGLPDVPSQLISIECAPANAPEPEKLLLCRPMAVTA